jgi:putative copper export protein
VSGSPGLLVAVFHGLEYLGLLGGLGSMVIRRLAAQKPRLGWVRPPLQQALAVALVGGIGVVAAGPSAPGIARVAAEAIALVLCVRGIPFVAPMLVLSMALLPFSGHAAAVEPPAGAEFADVLHVLSAGMWAGGILALATLRPPAGWRGAEARLLLDRFAGVALITFGVTALTGVLRATEQLHGVGDLWTTSYGIVLALKSCGVAIMLALSSLAWRRGLPVARLEAAVTVSVVAATAVLAAYPAPG